TFVDIDVANTCTHNCVFCGLYSDESLERYKKSNGGKFESALLKKMAAKIDRDDCLNFINSLSDATQFVQFGGLGDPFTHKNIVEFISACRSRNFSVSCLTNFSYMNEEILNELHTMSSTDPEALTFIVNLSAANAATYMLNRPNQKQTTFEKVISDLKYSQRLRERDGHGITFSLMSVTNKLNYRDMPELVALAKDVGAEKIWIKPIEVHGDETLQYLIPESEQFEYARMAQLVLIFAKQLNVNVFMPEVLETLAKTFQKELLDYQKHTPIEKQFEILAEKSELIRRYYQNAAKSEFKHNLKVHQVPYFPIPLTTLNDVTPIENVQLSETASTEENKLDLGVANADLPAQFYDKLSCKIGYQYFRVEVLGNALPCCISNIQLDNIKGRHLKDIWLSDQLDVFRDKMNRINIEKFHRTDSEWMFCQQCPHVGINENFHMTRGINIKPIVR
ncbi:MAG: SPASM domain-containing protein, partial [Pseudobdellovibrio sp.]